MAETDTQISETPAAVPEPSREYHRAEDGRFTSPPAESKETGATPKQSESVIEPKVAGKADAPTKPTTEEIQRREYDRLVAKRQSSESRTSEPPSPSQITLSQQSTPATAGSGDVQPAAGIQPSPQQQDNKLPDEYKSVLNTDQYTLLKRVGWLLPAEEMKAMGIESLADTLRAARSYRADLDRNYQQNKQQQPNQNLPLDQGNAPQDFSGQAQRQAGQGQSQVRLPDEVEAHLRSVASEYGEDSPVYLAMKRNEEVRQLQFQQLFNQRQEESHANRAAMFQAVEDNVFASLQSKFPKLGDEAEREELRALARAHAGAMLRIGRQVGPQQAIQFVSQARYYPEIQEQERKRLAQSRQSSLSHSVERGTPVARPAASMSREDRERFLYDEAKKRHDAKFGTLAGSR